MPQKDKEEMVYGISQVKDRIHVQEESSSYIAYWYIDRMHLR